MRHFHSLPFLSYDVADEVTDDVADVKKSAIFDAVKLATKLYGNNVPHRFGMSDDDPKNVKLIKEAMMVLKSQHKQMSFFVISTEQGGFVKQEVLPKSSKFKAEEAFQLDLF